MPKNKSKKFISIRARLFLQVGAVILIAILLILLLNNFLLPSIYTISEKNTMKSVCAEINLLDQQDETYDSVINYFEKTNSFSIDIYGEDGTPIYTGTEEIFSSGGKVVVSKRTESDDGSFFEIQTNEKEKIDYLVYGQPLKSGGDIEMFSRKSTVDDNANMAIMITSATSVTALLAALIFIYFYTGKFTKPLIQMSSVTSRMADMDFTQKCSVKGNDEISMLSSSINYMSDSLDETLKDLSNKNRQLEADIEKEKTLEKIRKDFISNVSHELKTPISIIRGYSEGAQLMLDSGDSDGAKKYCDVIVNETDKMNVLVLQLLELSMYESGSVSLAKNRFSIYDLISEYADDNQIKFNEKGITFVNGVSEDCFGLGDTIKLGMVINNYISNAVSHCDGEKIIKVDCTENESKYRVTVFNTGKPIDEEDIDKIWISFYRADKSHSRSEGRFGLGLSIVSAIQQLYGCDYGVYNTENGVCFWFDIQKDDED